MLNVAELSVRALRSSHMNTQKCLSHHISHSPVPSDLTVVVFHFNIHFISKKIAFFRSFQAPRRLSHVKVVRRPICRAQKIKKMTRVETRHAVNGTSVKKGRKVVRSHNVHFFLQLSPKSRQKKLH